ncbi:hypothetical protein H6F42_15755 [Pseudanabaena sp. FACHB-1998]|uniref:hypothetical protein n=1 Tax=Pseudanabaena sp. FACHB-1998 TaxID=2692858 RepID=UPI0016802B6C|nr:hypothetical protein [Pseudanabaena sp. FACHB-1998]MBD2178374.1 hypothetical protein [Pseudanabaena sp. FACHB-1998]
MTQLLTEAIRIANTLSEEDQNADNNESALAQRTIAKNGLKPMFIKKVVVSESQNLLDKNFG